MWKNCFSDYLPTWKIVCLVTPSTFEILSNFRQLLANKCIKTWSASRALKREKPVIQLNWPVLSFINNDNNNQQTCLSVSGTGDQDLSISCPGKIYLNAKIMPKTNLTGRNYNQYNWRTLDHCTQLFGRSSTPPTPPPSSSPPPRASQCNWFHIQIDQLIKELNVRHCLYLATISGVINWVQRHCWGNK